MGRPVLTHYIVNCHNSTWSVSRNGARNERDFGIYVLLVAMSLLLACGLALSASSELVLPVLYISPAFALLAEALLPPVYSGQRLPLPDI